MWDLSSPTRDRTCVPCIGRRILYYWTTREVPSIYSYAFGRLHIFLGDYSDFFIHFQLDCLFFFFFLKIYLLIDWLLCWVFVSVLGLSLAAASGGHSSSRCAGLSLSWPLLLRSTSSRRAGSAVVVHGPSCSTACGILPDQGSNPCPLHKQADSQPLRHQGSPDCLFFYCWVLKFFVYTFRYRSFTRYVLCKCFIPFYGLSFHPFNSVFHVVLISSPFSLVSKSSFRIEAFWCYTDQLFWYSQCFLPILITTVPDSHCQAKPTTLWSLSHWLN